MVCIWYYTFIKTTIKSRFRVNKLHARVTNVRLTFVNQVKMETDLTKPVKTPKYT